MVNIDDYLDDLELDLLQAGGVDNWDGYDYAIDIRDQQDIDLLNALYQAGVDNWEFYDESLGDFSDYSDYVHAVGYEDALGYDDWLEEKYPHP